MTSSAPPGMTSSAGWKISRTAARAAGVLRAARRAPGRRRAGRRCARRGRRRGRRRRSVERARRGRSASRDRQRVEVGAQRDAVRRSAAPMSATSPVPGSSRTSSPARSSRSATSAVVRTSARASSGWACRSRRSATSSGRQGVDGCRRSRRASRSAVSVRSHGRRLSARSQSARSPAITAVGRQLGEPDADRGSERVRRDVEAPDVAQRVADLADGGPRRAAPPSSGRARCRCPAAAAVSAVEGRVDRGAVALGPQPRQPLGLLRPRSPGRPAAARTAPPRRARNRLTPTTTRSPASISRAIAVGRPLDLALLEALLDRGHRAAEVLDLLASARRAAASTSSVIASTT